MSAISQVRTLVREKARELTPEELMQVGGAGDGYCWICERTPQGGGGHDEQVYSPD